jgi:hypothetical protein
MFQSVHIKSTPPAPILVVALGPQQASVTLFFDFLPIEIRRLIRVIFCGDATVKQEMIQARTVIFVRSLVDYEGLIAFAKHIGLPMYHYCDDNFNIICEEIERYGSAYAFYTRDNMRNTLADFAGCLLAVPNLVEFYRLNNLHSKLLLYPPIAAFSEYGDLRPVRQRNQAFTVSFFGGGDRRAAFNDYIVPAVKQLSKTQATVLVAFGIDRGTVNCEDFPNLMVHYPPYEPDYALAIRQFRHYAPDVMLHSSSPTRNNAFKNCNNIINGAVAGAAMICSRTEPYLGLDEIDATLLADDTSQSWYLAMWQLANCTSRLRQLQIGAKRYCENTYSGAQNSTVIVDMLETCPRLTDDILAQRKVLAYQLAVSQAATLEHDVMDAADAVNIRAQALAEGAVHQNRLFGELSVNREKINALAAGVSV